MKKLIYTSTIFLFILLSCKSQKINPEDQARQLKNEALNFSLKFVESVFDRDCELVISLFSKYVIALNENEFIYIGEEKDDICEALDEENIFMRKTYKDYLNDYKYEILTPSEMATKLEIDFPSIYNPSPNDFFFDGTTLKNKDVYDYLSDDVFSFMVRKENEVRKIIAVND